MMLNKIKINIKAEFVICKVFGMKLNRVVKTPLCVLTD
jgi:hypothetical protein